MTKSIKPTRVLIVDDHKIFREGLVSLISAQEDMKVIGDVGSSLGAIKFAVQTKPDIIIMDIKLHKVSGIETTKKILQKTKKHRKKPKIIVLSMYDDESHVMDSIRAGAVGYLTKTCAKEELIGAIKCVMNGRLYIHKENTQGFVNMIKNLPVDINKKLTSREIDIVKLVAQGFSNKEISKVVYSAEKTVKNQLNSVFQKLGAVNRAHAVTEAIKRNIISSDLP